MKAREFAADWRAAGWSSTTDDLKLMLSPRSSSSFRLIHPSRTQRIQKLDQPESLFASNPAHAFQAGMLWSLIFSSLTVGWLFWGLLVTHATEWFFWMLAAQPGFSPASALASILLIKGLIPAVLVMLPALLFGALVTLTLGISVQREAICMAASPAPTGIGRRRALTAGAFAIGAQVGMWIVPLSGFRPGGVWGWIGGVIWMAGLAVTLLLWSDWFRRLSVCAFAKCSGEVLSARVKWLTWIAGSLLATIMFAPSLLATVLLRFRPSHVPRLDPGVPSFFVFTGGLVFLILFAGVVLGFAYLGVEMWRRRSFAQGLSCESCHSMAGPRELTALFCNQCGMRLMPWLFSSSVPCQRPETVACYDDSDYQESVGETK